MECWSQLDRTISSKYGICATARRSGNYGVTSVSQTRFIISNADSVGTVKAIQVEDTLCLTGGADGNVRLWDLRMVEDYEDRLRRMSEREALRDPLDRIAERDVGKDDENWEEGASGYTEASHYEEGTPCVRTLEGHSKSVTALYYEDGCLVSSLALYDTQS
jgi:division protein 1